jgi:hypothetical protein
MSKAGLQRGGDIDETSRMGVAFEPGISRASTSTSARCSTGDRDRRSLSGGLDLYRYPGPGFEGLGENSAESSYYTWVDQHNTFGSENVPMSTGNLNDGVIALNDGKMIVLRVRIPWASCPGSTAASMIQNAGWKGRGCGPQAATEPPGSRKAAKEPSLSLCTSSCALIRWRIEGQSPPGHSLHDHAPRRSWRGAAIKLSRYCDRQLMIAAREWS